MFNDNFALIAHFDPEGKRSTNWKTLLSCVASVCSNGVVVSTGISEQDVALARDFGFRVICRENVGYDFMSYAVGIAASKDVLPSVKRLICNDSMYVTDKNKFISALERVLTSDNPVTFLTLGTQVIPHGQSFCFSVAPEVFNRAGFQNFFKSVKPQPNKWNVIMTYEIGLTQLLRSLGVKWSTVLDLKKFTKLDVSRTKKRINPMFFYADEIIKDYGFAKIERLSSKQKNSKNSKFIEIHIKKFNSSLNKESAIIPRVKPRAVVICHCHYLSVIDELIEFLDCLPDGCEIYVSSSNVQVLTDFKLKWQRKNIPLFVMAIDNWGRDVRPFIHVLNKIKIADDVPILKIHGKCSLYSPSGEIWRRDLLRSLLPSEYAINRIIAQFSSNPKLAILGAPGSYVSNGEYWGSNKKAVRQLLSYHHVDLSDNDLGFFAGTMFWIRSQCAKEMFSCIDMDLFEPENGQRDGTLGHALERSVPMTLRAKSWELREINNLQLLIPDGVRQRKIAYY